MTQYHSYLSTSLQLFLLLLHLHEIPLFDDDVHFLLPLPLADGDQRQGSDAEPKEKFVEESKVLDQPNVSDDGLKIGAKI